MIHDTDIWPMLIREAKLLCFEEPDLDVFLNKSILDHSSFETALAFQLAEQLGGPDFKSTQLFQLFGEIFQLNKNIISNALIDLKASFDRDAACDHYLTVVLHFKGFQALQAHRISNWLWTVNRDSVALFLQGRITDVFCVDIHPGAKFGSGIMIDHATGLVVGETSVIGNNVSILHGVTLGGNASDQDKRHPTIGDGVLISAGAKILGSIEVGEGAKIGAGSLVLKDVAPHVTVAGVPASVVGVPKDKNPALLMNQDLET